MEDRAFKCAFTGHRESKLAENWSEYSSEYRALKQYMLNAIENVYQSGIHYFICGMAHGCDLYFAETVLEFKQEHPDVELEAAIPYAGQADRWNEIDRMNYEEIKRRADEVTVLSEYYTRFCMQQRNRALVDSASVCICYLEQASGGTAYTVNYAQKSGIKIINLID